MTKIHNFLFQINLTESDFTQFQGNFLPPKEYSDTFIKFVNI